MSCSDGSVETECTPSPMGLLRWGAAMDKSLQIEQKKWILLTKNDADG
jgi:hypothetical protein